MTHWLDLALIALLILLNGFLAMSELAVVSARKARLQAMARRQRSRGAKLALALAAQPGRFLSAVQIGITLVGILAGAFSGATLAGPFGRWLAAILPPELAPAADTIAFALVVGGVTYASLIAGELVPKQLALRNPERIAAIVAWPMTVLARLAAPLVWLLERSSALLMRLLGLGRDVREAVSEEEISHLVAEAESAGTVEPEERRMIAAVMRLGDRPVRAVMTPRRDIDWLDLSAPHEAQVARLRSTMHLRLPAARGGIDEPLGVVSVKAVLDALLDGGRDRLAADGLQAYLQPVPAVHESADILDALAMLKRSPGGMAFVVDEFGSLEGIVTPADIMEAIAGGFALPGNAATPGALRRGDGSWLLDGLLPRGDAAERLGLHLPEEGEHHTMAGFLLERFGRLPEAGDSTDWAGWRFEVLDMDGRRIDKILAVPPPPEADAAADI